MRIPPAIVWALGATQIIGYGTLYYSFSVLAPRIAATFDLAQEWLFGGLSAALLAGGLLAPLAGRLMDRYGAARMMTAGSLLAAATLAATSLAPTGLAFVAGLVTLEMSAAFVLYAAAFAALLACAGVGLVSVGVFAWVAWLGRAAAPPSIDAATTPPTEPVSS